MADKSSTIDGPLRLFLDVFEGRLDFEEPAVEDAEAGAETAGTPVWIFSAAANPASSDAISSWNDKMLTLYVLR